MSYSQTYSEKFSSISGQTSFQHLPDEQRLFTSKTASLHRFTLQELRQFVEIALDLNRWNETNI
ncbi:MAG: hypothetical protein GY753_08765, partial [Gammaproteobacteria bacterium]|nr:hypothetical protein [Gammaproteobacteria bacterium]